MSTYTITFSSLQDDGLTAAREAANAAMPQMIAFGNGEVPNPALHADNGAYHQAIMSTAADSYVVQHGVVTKADKQKVADVVDRAVVARIEGAEEAKAVLDKDNPVVTRTSLREDPVVLEGSATRRFSSPTL